MPDEPDLFWREGPVGMYAYVEFGLTVAGFEGTVGQVLAMNKVCFRANHPGSFLALRLAPPLAHSAKRP